MVEHKCNLCEYKTNKKSNLSRHYNTLHEKINKEKNNVKNIKLDEIIKINDKYTCNNCNKLFYSIMEIEKHIKLECKYDIRYNNFYIFLDEKIGTNIFKNKEAGDIYIIQTDFSTNNVFKIGITTNLVDRLKTYRTGCNYEPKIHYYFPCKNITKADKLLKIKLRDYKIKREIYTGNVDQIKEIILHNLKQINDNIVHAYKPDIKINDICECIKCNKVFYTECDLNKHNKIIHIIQEKNNECCYCDKSFSTNSNLNKHKKLCKEKLEIDHKYKEELNHMKQSMDHLKELINSHTKLIATLQLENSSIKTLLNN